jgi:hypothetical protein
MFEGSSEDWSLPDVSRWAAAKKQTWMQRRQQEQGGNYGIHRYDEGPGEVETENWPTYDRRRKEDWH